MSKALVLIHGAGKQMSNFYTGPIESLSKVLSSAPSYLACWYADLSNVGSPVFGMDDPNLSPEAQQFRTELVEIMRERRRETEAQLPSAGVEYGLKDDADLIADLIDDVTGYLWSNEKFRTEAKHRLSEKLSEAAQNFDETILVSHSLGTVIAFDVLRDGAQNYRVSHFFTMGSPLRKARSLRARTSDVGQINPQTVAVWRNLYNPGDPVADPIAPSFPDYPIQDMLVTDDKLPKTPIYAHAYWLYESVVKMIADTLSA